MRPTEFDSTERFDPCVSPPSLAFPGLAGRSTAPIRDSHPEPLPSPASAGDRTPGQRHNGQLQLRSQSQLQTNPLTQTNPQAQTKTRARLYSIRPAAWAALAAAILLTISLLSWRQLHQTNTLAAELLDQHLATLSSAATPQVISSDRHTVKPWFQGRLPTLSLCRAPAQASPSTPPPHQISASSPSVMSTQPTSTTS